MCLSSADPIAVWALRLVVTRRVIWARERPVAFSGKRLTTPPVSLPEVWVERPLRVRETRV